MKQLVFLTLLSVLATASGQVFTDSSSKKVEFYQRYENGKLVEEHKYAEENGVPIENFDFDGFFENGMDGFTTFDMESKMAAMDLRMKEMQAKINSKMGEMKIKMAEIQQRQKEMMDRMNHQFDKPNILLDSKTYKKPTQNFRPGKRDLVFI